MRLLLSPVLCAQPEKSGSVLKHPFIYEEFVLYDGLLHSSCPLAECCEEGQGMCLLVPPEGLPGHLTLMGTGVPA